MNLMSQREYIAHAANARPIYVELFHAAVVLIPPIPGDYNVECHYTARDLAKHFAGRRSVSVIRNELQWLLNWRWITEITDRPGNIRFLGRKEGLNFHLQADVAAYQATGVERLVSRDVLGIKLEAPPMSPDDVSRGPNRRWEGDNTQQNGGTLDEILGA